MGRFGKVLYRLLAGHFKILIFSTHPATLREFTLHAGDRVLGNERDIFSAEVIFYAVPISKFQATLRRHTRFMQPHHLLIDVLSVKMLPARVFQEVCKQKKCRALLTHPMFGPDSAKDGFRNLPIVVSRLTATPAEYAFWKRFFARSGLRVVECSPSEHDRLAANSQGVAHFIGRLLKELKFKPTKIDTLGARKLHELLDQVCNDTPELFRDLQNYNANTKAMRLALGKAYDKLYNRLLPRRVRPGRLVIGIQGGKGSFNEQAILEYTKSKRVRNADIEYLYTSKRVMRELHNGNIDFGLFAIQNAVGGLEEESIHVMSRYKFRIVSEFPILVRHFLMRRKDNPRALPTRIMAHDQVFRQCAATLKKLCSKAKLITGTGDLRDTARAAQALAEGKIPKETFILGPKILAHLYDLDIVRGNLQDSEHNLTTFLLVSR